MCLVEDNSLPIPSGKENILIITGVINQVYFPNNVLKENDFSQGCGAGVAEPEFGHFCWSRSRSGNF